MMAGLALGVAGCSDDTSSNSEAKPEPSATTSATQSTSGSPASATAVKGRRTTVSMTEFAFKPDALSAKAGKLRVTATNDGSAPHELVLIRTTKAAGALPTKGDQASEAGTVGEIPEQKPGKSASHTFKLKRGAYVYICNLPGHYAAGMRGTLTVK
jgi:plastocyanin